MPFFKHKIYMAGKNNIFYIIFHFDIAYLFISPVAPQSLWGFPPNPLFTCNIFQSDCMQLNLLKKRGGGG